MTGISRFTFDTAQYRVQDSEGHTVILRMYYADNRYEIIGESSELFEMIAKDLLSRKHDANFAYKFSEFKVK